MELFYRILADIVVVVHFGYVAFVVGGQILILVGMALRWAWVRNLWFRLLHLLAILIVVGEAAFGMTCPLTTWENQLRAMAGQRAYEAGFIERWMDAILFYEAEPRVFTLCYTLFGLLVLGTFIAAPPLWKRNAGTTETPTDRGTQDDG